MQQKEQKQAIKKAADRRRMAATASDTRFKARKTSKKQEGLPVPSAYSVERHVAVAEEQSAELDDMGIAAVPAMRYVIICVHPDMVADLDSHYPLLLSSPLKLHGESEAEDAEYTGVNADVPAKDSPGSPKLKGMQWPSMALFDAATEELKRKRNQRKDVSVVEMLERNAAQVQPTETVHSVLGNVLKHRHMDDMENDSPVEGEEIIVEPTLKKRKTGTPRVRRQANAGATKRPGRPPRKQLETPIKRSLPSVSGTSKSVLPFSPAEDESSDFKPIIRKPGRKKNKKAFTIYEDSSPSFGGDGSSETMPSAYVDTNTVRPQLAFRHVPLSRQQVEAYDPFKLARNRMAPTTFGFADLGRSKENQQTSFFNNLSPHHQGVFNPLFFHGTHEQYGTNEMYGDENRLNPMRFPGLNLFSDHETLLPNRNPLMVAMDRLNRNETREDEYRFDEPTTQQRQPLFAP